MLAGCGPFIGWAVNAFAPPQKVEPVYRPPAGKRVLVFVDDLLRPVAYEPIKAELTEQLNRQLTEHDVAKTAVPYEDLLTLQAAMPEFNQLAVSEVARHLDAELVVYLDVDEFALKDDEANPLWQGRLTVSVRVVDPAAGRLWPDDRAGGYPVPTVEIPAHPHNSPNHGAELSRTLAAQMADRVAKLFYKHEISAREAAEREAKQR